MNFVVVCFNLLDACCCFCSYFSVSGFNHRALDEKQQNWFEFLYPYRLANYRKRALASPSVIGTIDYSLQSPENGMFSPIHQMTEIAFEINGTCDGIALWVDYILHEDYSSSSSSMSPHRLSFYQNNDFPPFMTQNIKFFQTPEVVNIDSKLIAEIYFENGQSDIQYHFEIRR
jgi:hypothetical protein